MEPLKPLSDFFNAIAGDPRISITHIGIYAALLQYWKEHHFEYSGKRQGVRIKQQKRLKKSML